MKYVVIYFTRSGTSRKIAEKIAKKLSVEPIEVTDNMDWDGALGYMRAAKHAMKNGAVAIQIHGQIGEADEYVVVSPMWCGKITPAIRKLLDEVPKEKVHLIVSSGGMNLKERDGYMSVLDIMKSKHNEDQLIEEFVGSLSA
ncbi:NAD(P)H-dependent oxidoreductase [Methanocorpusculum sp. GPch4]|uniref:flavodoxin family protein n=1 Tax=Methanocorpusculum sp. GPch4 TaxID=2527877 RepID=UPI00143286D2|nr:NAD(P)H-dependent oxidoreductase [Methanocorpusculum sp. GPch4]